jgi:biofilm PGA synthesis N-glycosyltransferase PgaC
MMDFAGFWHALLSVWAEKIAELAAIFRGSPHGLVKFVFVYPLAVSFLWTVSALHLLPRRRSRQPARAEGDVLSYTVLIPFYAEVEDAVGAACTLSDVEPPPDEIILVDDGSPRDAGGYDLTLPPRARFLRNPVRQGKAGALNAGLAQVRSEVVVCMDADSRAVTRDWSPMLARFRDRRLAAVTGKVWPADAASPLELLQALDYLAVIGLIKAAETLWGGLTTVSGAWVAFRRDALLSHGGWSTATAAEDIDLSWWFQARGWRVLYAPEWTATVETHVGCALATA